MGYNVKYFRKYSDNFSMPSEQISFRLSKGLLALLDDMADRELRTRTNLIEFILTSWLREHEPDSFDDFGRIIDPSALDEARKESIETSRKGRRAPKKPDKQTAPASQ
jgi:hypothetical protein